MMHQPDDKILNLHSSYRCENREAVEAFLRLNPDLLPYVEQSALKIAERFPSSELWLAVEFDEDDTGVEASREKLFVLIEVPESLSDALASLEQLDEEWAVDVCEATDDRLVIDLKY